MINAPFDHQLHLDPGEVIDGRYAALRRLARGGMGEVWAVRHCTLGEEFAMKILAPVCGIGDDTLSRFDLEARVGATLGRKSHYIVPVIDHGDHHGRPYLVMPLISGPSLEQRLAKGPLGLEETARIVRHVAKALTTAHNDGVLHRDLKPANVLLVEEEGRFFGKVTDFGIAKLGRGAFIPRHHSTVPHAIMGTPVYMSPEQANGMEVDERCDVWALAAIAYRCVLGRDAFSGRTALEILGRVASSTFDLPSAVSPNLPRALDAVFTRAFARELGDRFQDARSFADAFAIAAGVPELTTSLPPPAARVTIPEKKTHAA
jgi:serine/threonine-protein kinase